MDPLFRGDDSEFWANKVLINKRNPYPKVVILAQTRIHRVQVIKVVLMK